MTDVYSPSLDICQIAYFVSDIQAAALKMAETFGAGPFFVLQDIQLRWAEHRGEQCLFVHSSAYGQWGSIMLELVQQESPGASPFRDMYAPGEEGIHHVAAMVQSQEQAYTYFTDRGMTIATKAITSTGTEFAFVDARQQQGHFIEIYERSPGLTGFYDMVATAAQGWRGNDPIRML